MAYDPNGTNPRQAQPQRRQRGPMNGISLIHEVTEDGKFTIRVNAAHRQGTPEDDKVWYELADQMRAGGWYPPFLAHKGRGRGGDGGRK